MIRASIIIVNPRFKQKDQKFICVYECSKRVTKNKDFEFQVSHYNYNLIGATIDLRYSGMDHAGPELEFNFMGYTVSFSLRDKRHWNHLEGRWMTENEQGVDSKKSKSCN